MSGPGAHWYNPVAAAAQLQATAGGDISATLSTTDADDAQSTEVDVLVSAGLAGTDADDAASAAAAVRIAAAGTPADQDDAVSAAATVAIAASLSATDENDGQVALADNQNEEQPPAPPSAGGWYPAPGQYFAKRQYLPLEIKARLRTTDEDDATVAYATVRDSERMILRRRRKRNAAIFMSM